MATDTTTLKKGSRIVVTEALPGVPEGSPGKLGRSVGMHLVRYRVAFDNGTSFNSVAHTKLVPEDQWETFQEEREAAAAKAAAGESEAAAAPAAAADGDGGGAAPADDRLAKMLARSKAAREKKAAGG